MRAIIVSALIVGCLAAKAQNPPMPQPPPQYPTAAAKKSDTVRKTVYVISRTDTAAVGITYVDPATSLVHYVDGFDIRKGTWKQEDESGIWLDYTDDLVTQSWKKIVGKPLGISPQPKPKKFPAAQRLPAPKITPQVAKTPAAPPKK